MNVERHFRSILLTRFLEELSLPCDGELFVTAIKRLSGNDTGLTGGHQGGLYLPKQFIAKAIPTINTTEQFNPSAYVEECYIASHDMPLRTRLRAIYYNSKVCPLAKGGKTRNEFRITCWGGSENPLQQEENTGCLVVLAIIRDKGVYKAVVWLAQSDAEEELIQAWAGCNIEGGEVVLKKGWLPITKEEGLPDFPQEWIKGEDFPDPHQIFSFVESQLPFSETNIDKLLVARRDLEFRLFQEIERLRLEPHMHKGMVIEEFIKRALTVLNRRKSRSGKSLELQLSSIFQGCQLQFEEQVRTEGKKTVDFLFPSGDAYHDPTFPISRLTTLAAKTTCKDRWRQILNEADRFRDQRKHLFTLQEGVSPYQLEEMSHEGVTLVVPHAHLKKFPPLDGEHLMDLTQFVEKVRRQQGVA